MRDDDEILAAYEAELAQGEPSRRRGNRGFWMVAGSLLLAGVFLVVEILVNFETKDTIAHAQDSLRRAAALAEQVRAGSLDFTAADAAGLAAAAPSSRLTFMGPEEPSSGLDQVSVAVDAGAWAGAVQARPGACFHLRLDALGDVSYAVATDCTGTAAMAASDSRW